MRVSRLKATRDDGMLSGVLHPQAHDDRRLPRGADPARREASGCATSCRSAWPPTSGPTLVGPDGEAAASPRSAGSATGSSSTRSSGEPRCRRARPEAPRHQGRDVGPLAGGGEETPRDDGHGDLPGLRDRALLSVILCRFAAGERGAGDAEAGLLGAGSCGWLWLSQRGGKRHDVPAHHRAAAALDAYVEAVELAEPRARLVQSVAPSGRRLTGRALERRVS